MKGNISKSSVFLLVFVLTIMTHACVRTHVENIPSGPLMVINERSFDSKEVKKGATVEHTFRVFNKGNKALEIKNVKTTWGFTVVRFDRAIPPGGEGDITLRLSTKSRRNIIRKSAVVYSNDPKHPEIPLTVTAHIKVPISIEPPGVMMNGFVGEDIKQRVTIRAHEDQPLTLEPLKLSLPRKVAYEIKTIEEGRVYQIVFRNISQKENKYSGVFTLKTNYTQMPEINIVVLGYIRNNLQFRPETIYFKRMEGVRVKGGKSAKLPGQRSVMVTLNRGDNLKIEKIEINQDLFEAQVKEIQAGRSYRIDVKLHQEKLPKGKVNEKMKVYTNFKDDPVKVIPIRVEKI